jgi:hypothetical protein
VRSSTVRRLCSQCVTVVCHFLREVTFHEYVLYCSGRGIRYTCYIRDGDSLWLITPGLDFCNSLLIGLTAAATNPLLCSQSGHKNREQRTLPWRAALPYSLGSCTGFLFSNAFKAVHNIAPEYLSELVSAKRQSRGSGVPVIRKGMAT